MLFDLEMQAFECYENLKTSGQITVKFKIQAENS